MGVVQVSSVLNGRTELFDVAWRLACYFGKCLPTHFRAWAEPRVPRVLGCGDASHNAAAPLRAWLLPPHCSPPGTGPQHPVVYAESVRNEE